MGENNMEFSDDFEKDSFEFIENQKTNSGEKMTEKEKESWNEYIKKNIHIIGLLTVIFILLIIVFQLQYKCSDFQETQEKNLEMIMKIQEESGKLLEQMKEIKESAKAMEFSGEPVYLKDLLGDEITPPIPANSEDFSSYSTSSEEIPKVDPKLTFIQLLPIIVAMIILAVLSCGIVTKSDFKQD
uniref:Septum formation initiator n=1 Tax=Caenorhabditis tropicalis TaxID=1561998 RepID=A0A1I7SY11_9PELO